jgi:hypothetical protein
MFTSDIHCPIMSSKNKINDIDKIMKSVGNLICITENNKYGTTYDEWEKLSKKYNMNIVSNNILYQM